MDKIDIIKNALQLFMERTQQEIEASNEKEEKLKEGIQDNEPAPDELVHQMMFGCYLEGMKSALQMFIDILEDDMFEKLLEKLEELKNRDIAKA